MKKECIPVMGFRHSHIGINFTSKRIYKYCGGVKPRPTIEAQEHRFIKSTPEEEKSLRHHVDNTGARKCPRRLLQEEHPPRI